MQKLRAILLAVALASISGVVQAQSPLLQRMEGIWIFRAMIPGQPLPAYTGTARFLPDGKMSGPPNDRNSGPTIGNWIRTGNKEFAFTFVANTYDEMGNFRTTNRVRGMMAISEDGLLAAGRTMVDILNSAGEIILSRTTQFTGSRVVVEPF